MQSQFFELKNVKSWSTIFTMTSSCWNHAVYQICLKAERMQFISLRKQQYFYIEIQAWTVHKSVNILSGNKKMKMTYLKCSH